MKIYATILPSKPQFSKVYFTSHRLVMFKPWANAVVICRNFFLDSNIRIFQCTFFACTCPGHSDQFLLIFVYFILNFLFSSKIRQRYEISQLCLWSSLTAQKSLQWLSQGIQSLSNQAQGVWRRHSGHLGPNWGDYNPCTYHSSWSQKGL